MSSTIFYGNKLTDKEYEQAIVNLYKELPALPSKQQEQEIRKKELFLSIDHRLGKQFPQEKRELLWKIQEKIEKKRLCLAMLNVIHFIPNCLLGSKVNKLTDYMISEYIKVLGLEETKVFFGFKDFD